MTKIFETEEDLANEQEVAAELGALWDCEFKKLDRRYQADFMICQDSMAKAWAELKCRSHSSNDWSTVILELDKCMRLSQLNLDTGLPSLFIVRWTDRIGWIEMNRPFLVKWINYNDRYNDVDGSPCAVFNVKDFSFYGDSKDEF
jgi:hypothetical protein